VAARGYHEVVTYSFVEAAWEADFSASHATGAAAIALANPIASQMGVMRSTLIGGLVGTLVANRKRQTERVRIFELGRCFRREPGAGPVQGFAQPLRLAGLAAGSALPEQWGAPGRRVDFYDIKADVEALFAPRHPEFVKAAHPALHPGRCADVMLDGRNVGVVGELHPRWVQKYELGTAPVVFELDLTEVLATPFPAYVEVSRFPAVVRDLALVVPQSQTLAPLLAGLRAAAPAIVRDVALFDVYHGKGLGESEKSLAFRVVMQDTQRTLEDREVEEVIAGLLAVATRDFNASLRS
jgi:phenylalanyl-tRNA synthetase beta chain